jgi:hypothetical protein
MHESGGPARLRGDGFGEADRSAAPALFSLQHPPLRRLAAREAVIGKRQVEELTVATSTDIEAFCPSRWTTRLRSEAGR